MACARLLPAAALAATGASPVHAQPWNLGLIRLPSTRVTTTPTRPTRGRRGWGKRPAEVRAAIDRVAADARLTAMLQPDAVGIFGGSAGGHTALSMAGSAWSAGRRRDHCLQHIAADFASCVGTITRLDGGWRDQARLWLAKRVIAWRFTDAHPLGLVTAALDVRQIPRSPAEAVVQACAPRCRVLMRLPDGGHGAMLSPLPPLAPGSLAAQLLSDPPGFDRAATLPRLHQGLADFFDHHLGRPLATAAADGTRPATRPFTSTSCAIPT